MTSRSISRRCGWRWPALGGLLVIGACQAQPHAGAAPTTEAELLSSLRAEIGEARCSSDDDCRTLAVGERACGGPAAWWAWSRGVSSPDRLAALANQLAVLQRERHRTSGMLSTCQYLADPGAQCQAQRCTLRSPASAR